MYTMFSEDLTNVGGPMHSAGSTLRWVKNFESLESAKKFAEKEYGNKIKWVKNHGEWYSGDLGWVDYLIHPIKFED
ncbi:MAG: hypothetical protein M0P14_00715 [Alkaliphilus sp.]|nr:hypothetical protein [Alkaliphilus sp.]